MIPDADLHLKVRGVALWIKTVQGESPGVIAAAFATLLRAAEALAATGPADNFVLQLCHEHAHIGSFTWRATVSQASRYRCPICEPQDAAAQPPP